MQSYYLQIVKQFGLPGSGAGRARLLATLWSCILVLLLLPGLSCTSGGGGGGGTPGQQEPEDLEAKGYVITPGLINEILMEVPIVMAIFALILYLLVPSTEIYICMRDHPVLMRARVMEHLVVTLMVMSVMIV